jgi:hypothetical protein
MSNGSSVLDESASALFAYAAPEIERSKVLFEELCRSFDGNDMQGKDDQMLLFEKLSAGLFEDMILMGLCMHAIVRWKCDEQQLKTERHNVAVYLEQEKLFQEQLKDDMMDQRRLQAVNIGLSAQLQQTKSELKAREDALRQVEEARDELAANIGINAQLQQTKLELKAREDALRQVEEARDELAVQLREAKLTVIGLEGEQRRQKSSTPSPVKEPVEGYESPFWKALRGEAGENQGELGRNFGSVKAHRATILIQDHEGVYSQMNETEKLQEVFQNTAGMLGENQPLDFQRMHNSAQTVVKS